MSFADELVLTVRFQLGRTEVEANACAGDPDSPYADAWQLYAGLASALDTCADTEWVIPSSDCDPTDER